MIVAYLKFNYSAGNISQANSHGRNAIKMSSIPLFYSIKEISPVYSPIQQRVRALPSFRKLIADSLSKIHFQI